MSLTSPRILFGLHSITPFRRTDRKPYGILKVVGSASMSLTAETENDEIENCLAAGCNGYLCKPLELTAFYGALRKCLIARDIPLATKGGAA